MYMLLFKVADTLFHPKGRSVKITETQTSIVSRPIVDVSAVVLFDTAAQREKAVSAYFTSKQIPPFGSVDT